jgi:hypothetical protein
MVHATRIKDGAASFCNAFVDTHKLREEKRACFPIFAKVRPHSVTIQLFILNSKPVLLSLLHSFYVEVVTRLRLAFARVTHVQRLFLLYHSPLIPLSSITHPQRMICNAAAGPSQQQQLRNQSMLICLLPLRLACSLVTRRVCVACLWRCWSC